MRLEGLAHLSAIEHALQLDFNSSLWQFNQTALEDLNDVMFGLLTPAIVVLVVAMAIGVFGNLAICFVFIFKMKASPQNHLLLSLGIFDLVSCCVGVPAEIYDMRHYFRYQSVAACKTLRFMTIVPTLSSVLVLLVIAVERYRKICYPLHPQFEFMQIRVAVVAIVFISAVVSIPALFLYGHRSFPTGIPNLYGHDCSIDDSYKDGIFPLLYEALFATAFAVAIIILISLYLRILIETRRHTKYMRKHAIAGGAYWEERTLSSGNDFGLLETDSTCYSVETSKGDKKRSSASFKVARLFKRRKKSGKDRNVTASDKVVDVWATVKMTPELCTRRNSDSQFKDDAVSYFEKRSDGVRFHSHHTVINEDDDDKFSEDVDREKDDLHFDEIKTDNNVDYQNQSAVPRNTSSSYMPTTVSSSLIGYTEDNSIDMIGKTIEENHEKSRVKNRDISITKQPLLQGYDATDSESNNAKTNRYHQAPSPNHKPANSHSDSCTPVIESENDKETISIETTGFESEAKDVTVASSDNSKAPLKPTKSMVSLNTVKVRRAISSRRATVIAFIITFSFILSYLPHLILIILRSVIRDFEHDLSEASLVLYNIFLRSYFANNVINVFVYGSMNIEFRLQLTQIMSNMRTCFRCR